MADTRKPYILGDTTMFIDGRDYGPGDEVLLDPARGDELAEQGLVTSKAEARRGRHSDSEG